MEVFCTSKVVSRCFLSAVWVFPDIKWFDDQIWCTTPRLFGCCPTAVAGLIFFGWGHLQAICRPFDRPCVARGYSFPHETGKIKIETPTWISHHQWSLTFYTPAISESFINRGPFSNRQKPFGSTSSSLVQCRSQRSQRFATPVASENFLGHRFGHGTRSSEARSLGKASDRRCFRRQHCAFEGLGN